MREVGAHLDYVERPDFAILKYTVETCFAVLPDD